MADLIKPDLCVIGAGTLGIDLALQARQRGLDVVLVDFKDAGATDPVDQSLHLGALVASADRAQAIRTAARLGLDNTEPKPNFRAIAERAATIARAAEPNAARARLAALGIVVFAGGATFVDKQTLSCGETLIRARQFALTTGSRPAVPTLPGLDEVPFFTPDTIVHNIRKLSHLVVLGGEPAAVELAQAYRRLGSEVTLVPQGAVLPGFEPELVAILMRSLREEGVIIRDDAEAIAIVPRRQGTGVTLRVADDEESLDVSHILVAMGRVPVLGGDLLDKLSLRRDRLVADHLLVGPDGQTSNRRVSALGGAAGEHRPHMAKLQAALLVERLLGLGNGRLDPSKQPRFVTTGPALAQVGKLDSARPLRTGEIVLRSNLAEIDAARASGEPQGAVRLVCGRDGAVLGVGAVGSGAGEFIALSALAMARGLPLGDLSHLALPQPSLAAALVDLARQHQAQQKPAKPVHRLPVLGRLFS